MAIAKIIHAVWIGSKTPPKHDMKSYVSKWRDVLKESNGWTFYWWTDNTEFSPPFGEKKYIPNLVLNNDYCKSMIEDGKYAYASDYVRFWILHAFGGIYLDLDVEMVKPFNDLLESPGYIIGYEFGNKIQIGTMGCNKGNKFFKSVLDSYSDKSFDRTLTGPQRMTKVYKDGKYTFEIKPYDWYIAKNLYNGIVTITDNTYCIHHYSGSWLNLEGRINIQFRILLNQIFCRKSYNPIILRFLNPFWKINRSVFKLLNKVGIK